MAPKADPCDGKLSVCLVHGMSRLRTMILLPTIMLGKHILFRGVERFECETIEIKFENQHPFHGWGTPPILTYQSQCYSRTNTNDLIERR